MGLGVGKENRLNVADQVISTVDWSTYWLADGAAVGFGRRLMDFLTDSPSGDRRGLWETMENHVFSQDDIFSAAEPSISVLLASLIDQHSLATRIAVLDLLFHIVQAASYRNDDLGSRCMRSAATGAWLLVAQAIAGPRAVTEACIEILEIAAPQYAEFVQQTS